MGFFSDLKADLSQAVSELIPENDVRRSQEPGAEILPDPEDDLPDPSMLLRDFPEPKREKVIFHKLPEGMEHVTMPVPPLRELPYEDSVNEKTESPVPDGARADSDDGLRAPSDGVTVFARGTAITGEIRSEGALRVEEGAVIIGNISAPEAEIAGAVKGDIDVKGPVILRPTAVVVGNIRSRSVRIDIGAVIEGMCSQCYADKSPVSIFDVMKKEGSGMEE